MEAQDGDIAVCVVDGEFTVKRLSMKADGIVLVPANADYQPIRVGEADRFEVWGVVTYVIKRYAAERL